MKLKRGLALGLAGVMAVTSSICAYADEIGNEAVKKALAVVKQRIEIPEEYTEFTYSVSNQNLSDSYSFYWTVPDDVKEYKAIEVGIKGGVITDYSEYNNGTYATTPDHFAKLSESELYKKAKAAVKKLNPTVADSIEIDRDSLKINVDSSSASFSLVRVRNGIPVTSNSGSIYINKDTGELKSFRITWHEKASFKSADNIIDEDAAKKAYIDMIGIEPVYEKDYSTENNEMRLVYRQSEYGEINAYTGKKSDFSEDGYYMTTEEASAADVAMGNPATGGGGDSGISFTEQELTELEKSLPYGNKDKVIEVLKSKDYFSFSDNMELTWSNLYKETDDGQDEYFFSVRFESNWDGSEKEENPMSDSEPLVNEKINLTINAENGEIIRYRYSSDADIRSKDYDVKKADELAKKIAEELSGKKFGEYGNYESTAHGYVNGKYVYDSMAYDSDIEEYTGSTHRWQRLVNDIKVSSNTLNVQLNADMKLENYVISYSDVEFPSPKDMLSKDKAVEIFWKNNDITLQYLARLDQYKTKTVLVYAVDNSFNMNAITGESLYGVIRGNNDLSGIKDKDILAKAEKLNDHRITLAWNKFSEDDIVTGKEISVAFDNLNRGNFVPSSISELDDEKQITKGEAIKLFVERICGSEIPTLKGIYKSPYSNIKDNDPDAGYYAIAYALGADDGKTLDADAKFTMGELIEMLYGYLSR